MRAKNCVLFDNILERVHSKQHVDHIRNNILVAKMKQIQDSNSTSSANRLPEQFKNYTNYMALKKKVQDVATRNAAMRIQEITVLERIKQNNIKKLKLDQILEAKDHQNNILQAKCISLDNQITKEKEIQKNIERATPVKCSSNTDIVQVNEAIKACMTLLKRFYDEMGLKDDATAKTKLWQELNKILRSIPNAVVFHQLIKQLDAHVNTISSQSCTNSELRGNPKDTDQKLITKLNTLHIKESVELHSLKKQLAHLKEVCAQKILNFQNDLEAHMINDDGYAIDYEDEDVIGDYVATLLKRLDTQGKIQYCHSTINALKLQVEQQEESVNAYQAMVADTKNINIVVEEKVSSVQQDVAQFHQISEKLNFAKISMMRLVQDLKASKSQQRHRMIMNQTLSEKSFMNQAVSYSVPAALANHLLEIQTFLEIPINHFEIASNSLICELRNDVLLNDVENSSLLHLTSAHMLTLNGFLHNVKMRLKLGKEISSISIEMEPKVQLGSEVNIDDLKQQQITNQEVIQERLDSITKINVNCKKLLREAYLISQFAIKNPLRKFVPPTKKFDGRAYTQWESEFMMYYRML